MCYVVRHLIWLVNHMNQTNIGPASEVLQVRSKQSDTTLLPSVSARRILFEIFTINAFEQSVIELKREDCVWGPIHISLGQEAIAAASIAVLRRSDMITGSHRAHHITLAKILEYLLPDEWDPSTDEVPPDGREAVYRTLAEIMGLAPGWCGGRGGSMHLRHREAGVLGTNAIVAGGVPLSVGAALASRKLGREDVVIAYMGDGGVNQGSFHEACNMASLWRLPIIFFVENNQYAVATSIQDASATSEIAHLAIPYQMPARQVLGYDVSAIYSVVQEAVESLRSGGRPWFIEAKCYRHLHHGGDLKGSQYKYRDKAEEDEWLSKDAFSNYPEQLLFTGVLDNDGVESIRRKAEGVVESAVERCTSGGTTQDSIRDNPRQVRPELWPAPDSIGEGVRSSGEELSGLPYRSPSDFKSNIEMKYSDAIAAATGRWMEKDERVIVLGEEVANFGGGAYGATKDLPEKYPDRIINTPISEGGFSGVGLGMAMAGLRPVVEIMFPDFTLVAADQIFNQIGKARHMYGNTTDLPLVLRTRIATGCGYGGQHSMDPVGLYALFPGWRIVAPSNSFDYIGLFNTAMYSLDPVVFMEHHALYGESSPVPADDLDFCIPFGKSETLYEGSDVTVAVYGSMVSRAVKIAERLTDDVSIEIIDLRTLDLPSLDFESIEESLEKTGTFAIVEQAAGGQAIGHRVAAEVTQRFFDLLDGPPGVLTAMDVPNPVSRKLEETAMLSNEQISSQLRDMGLRRWR